MTAYGGGVDQGEFDQRNIDAFDPDLFDDSIHHKVLESIRVTNSNFILQTRSSEQKANHLFAGSLVLCACVYVWQLFLTQAAEKAPLPNKQTTLNVELTQRTVVTPKPQSPSIEQTSLPMEDPKTEETKPTALPEPVLDDTPNKAPKNNSPSLSIAQSIKEIVEADSLRQNKLQTQGGVALRKETTVFDSKFKSQLESAETSEMNAVKLSGHSDEYRDVYGNIVKRSGRLCATTYDLAQVGAFTYYSACPKPASKIRRFGREEIKRNP